MVLISSTSTPVKAPFIQCNLYDGVTGRTYTQLVLTDFQLVLDGSSHGVATVEGVYSILWQRNSKGGWFVPPPSLLPNTKKMILEFGLKPNMIQFPCEIYSSRIVSSSSVNSITDAVRVQYTLVAASWNMQRIQKTRSWTTGATYSYLAKSIAYAYGFNAVVDNSFKVFPYVLQNKETDFAFLTRIAREIGYTFFIDGTTLFFINPLHALESTSGKGIPQLVMNKAPGFMDSLSEWIPDNKMDTGADISRKVFSFNPNTNSVVEATNQYLNFTAFDEEDYKPKTSTIILSQDKAVNNYKDASDYARFNALINIKWITSQFRGLGDARIKPGSVVDFEGDALVDGSKGFWFVNTVTHRIIPNPLNPNMNQYYVTGQVARDQVYDNNIKVDAAWKAVRTLDSKLVSGQWKAVRIGDDTGEV